MSGTRAEIFGTLVDVLDLTAAVERIVELRLEGHGGCVVTPNLDHTVRLHRDDVFRAAYEKASLALADGVPLVWASRLGGPPLPSRVAGSDLVLPLCAAAAEHGLRVFFLGTRYETLCAAARELKSRYPRLEIAGTYSPAMGFAVDSAEDAVVQDMLRLCRPDLVFVALGSPKQELWADSSRDRLHPAVLVSIGAALDFIAGSQRRAPRWVRALALEWLYRALSNPVRLGPRYLRDLVALPGLLIGQVRHARRQRQA